MLWFILIASVGVLDFSCKKKKEKNEGARGRKSSLFFLQEKSRRKNSFSQTRGRVGESVLSPRLIALVLSVSFVCVTWLIHICDITHSCVKWLGRVMTQEGRRRERVSKPVGECTHVHAQKEKSGRLIHMRDMSHSSVQRDASFICVTWRIHMCDMTHSYLWHDAFICVTWLIHMCDMTHSYVWHDAFIRVT